MLSTDRSLNLSGIQKYLLPILVFSFGLQLLRAFIPGLAWYLRDTVGIGTLSLIPYAFGTFFLGFLAPLLLRIFGDRGALWITAGGLALVRFIEQISRDPAFDFWLAIAGTGLFLNFISIYIGHIRGQDGSPSKNCTYGLILGFAFDTALRGLFGARDLSTVSGFIPITLVALIAILIFWSLWQEPKTLQGKYTDGIGKGTYLLLAIGPLFTLQLLYLGSQGWVEEVAGLGYPIGFVVVLLGYLAAAGGLSLGYARPKSLHPLLAAFLTVILVLGFFYADQIGGLSLLLLILGQFYIGWGLAVISSVYSSGKTAGLWRTTLSVAGGMVIFLALSFAYYIGLDMALPIPRGSFPAIAAALFGILIFFGTFPARKNTDSSWDYSGVAMGTILVLVPLVYWLVLGAGPKPELGNGYPVKVMSYNIHSAFNVEGSQDLEAIASVIENSGADIIGLQEVSRVRLMDGSADMPTWLANRLEMQLVFQGTEEPIWGNAILSRFPIIETGFGDLPKDGSLIKRGYLWALIDVGAEEPLLVIVTHLHQVVADVDVRLAQVPVIMDFWDEGTSTVFVGDMNAKPDSAEMGLIAEAGLVDSWIEAGAGSGFTDASNNPVKRIDFIWHSPDLETVEIEVIQAQASDHLPVIATLE
jgi:endonuclease/exonuclease/phosphatase family metal-dependent hydrolase/MFS family permease